VSTRILNTELFYAVLEDSKRDGLDPGEVLDRWSVDQEAFMDMAAQFAAVAVEMVEDGTIERSTEMIFLDAFITGFGMALLSLEKARGE
jgi:hypothetical protein